MKVCTSPQLRPLMRHLTDTMRTFPLPPRDSEIIVVQSQGMRRWVTLQLADELGCAASLLLPFPAHFARLISERLQGPLARGLKEVSANTFSREALAWRIDAQLQVLPQKAEFLPLHKYLSASDERSRFGLAEQIAARFDDYQMYRADLLVEWEAGANTPDTEHAAWQASLWRNLCAQAPQPVSHLASQFSETIQVLKNWSAAANADLLHDALPARITVFGVSSLPPSLIQLLSALDPHVPVTIYTACVEPSNTHPLALSFGEQSREFLDMLAACGGELTFITGKPTESKGRLATIQSELTRSIAHGSPDGAAPAIPDGAAPAVAKGSALAVTHEASGVATHDASLTVHCAHGRIRQLEVLRDQIIAALSDIPTLRPHDVLLLVPDASEWAPLVDAVFGAGSQGTVRLPYRIADRPSRQEKPAVDAFLALLAIEGGRMARSEVMGLLTHTLVRQAAELTLSQVEQLDALSQRANVRWGYDENSRAALGLPRYPEATWREGLDTLLLGVAMGNCEDEVLGTLPLAGDTAGDSVTLGRFAEWVDDLASTLHDWRTSRTLVQWSDTLLESIALLLRAESQADKSQLQEVIGAVQNLGTLATATGYDTAITFGIVRDWLETTLDSDGFGSGFLSGGMTVAALKPMRSLPFKVIAVAGLDDSVFPRRGFRSAFDLLEHNRRPGDRDLASDDKQLFLDILLAAEERLILAYGGRAVSDNSPRAPSIVLDELLDHLDHMSAGQARSDVVVIHPLQPFSSGYFASNRDPRLFTFEVAEARAANAARVERTIDVPFTHEVKIAGESGEFLDLNVRALTDCFSNPSRYHCREVLGVNLSGGDASEPDDEYFVLDPMQKGLLLSRMLADALSCTRDSEREMRRLIARGELPPRQLGRVWHSLLSDDVKAVLEAVPVESCTGRLNVQLVGTNWALNGRIEGMGEGVRIVARAGPVRPEARIRAWVEHLVMCAQLERQQRGESNGVIPSTLLIGKLDSKKYDTADTFAPVRGALQVVDALIGQLRLARMYPLPFFAQAGYAWAVATLPAWRPPRSRIKTTDPSGRNAARNAYNKTSDRFNPVGGDCEDDYIELCFRGRDPLEDNWKEFARIAATLFDARVLREDDR